MPGSRWLVGAIYSLVEILAGHFVKSELSR